MKKIISLFLICLFVINIIPNIAVSAVTTISTPVAEIIDSTFIKLSKKELNTGEYCEYNYFEQYFNNYGWVDTAREYYHDLNPDTTYKFRIYNEKTGATSSVLQVKTRKKGPATVINNIDNNYITMQTQPNCKYWVYEYVKFYGNGDPPPPAQYRYAELFATVTSLSAYETIKGLKPDTKYVVFSDGQGINDVGLGDGKTFQTLKYPQRASPENISIDQEHEKSSSGKPTSYVKLTAHASNYDDSELLINNRSNPVHDYAPNKTYNFTIYAKAVESQYSQSVGVPITITTIKRGMWEQVGSLSLSSKTSTSFTVTCNENTYSDILEYSIDGENWQTSNTFKKLTPDTQYTVLARHNPELNQAKYDDGTQYCNYYYGPTEPYYYSKLNITTMKQTETPYINKILDTSIVCSQDENTKYRIRKINTNTYIENDTGTFTGLSEQTVYYISKRRNIDENTYDWSNEIRVQTKGSAKTAPEIEVESVGIDNVTLTKKTGCEYSIDNVTWQESNVFVNLSANTSYVFYIRYAETDDYVAGKITSVEAKTNKTKPEAEININNTIADSFSATVYASTSTSGFSLEYSIDNQNWQLSNTFNNLSPNTAYTIYVRIAETDSYGSGDTRAVNIQTKKNSKTPNLLRAENTKITLEYNYGYKYKINNGVWQTSNIFDGLSPGTSYTLYQLNATNDEYGTSQPIYVMTKTQPTPIIPSEYQTPTVQMENVKNNSIKLNSISGYEYRIENGAWQSSSTFNNLQPYTEYVFYQRIAETDLASYSETSLPLSIRTLKNSNDNIPSNPTLYEKYTDSSTKKSYITINTNPTCEYSIDSGGTWVRDSTTTTFTFSNLTPGSTYYIHARYAETEDTYSGPMSSGLYITLDKATVSKPTQIVTSDLTVTDTTIKINNYDNQTYKYSLDNISWTTMNFSGTFCDLFPATEYKIYRRIRETSTTYESSSSDATIITTDLSTVNAPNIPIISKYTSSSITIKTISGCEYGIAESIYDVNNENSISWKQSSSSTYTFSNLTHAHQYYIYQRYYKTSTSYASKASYVAQKTDLRTPNPPTVYPTVKNKTDSSIEFETFSTYDYGLLDNSKTKDNITWQKNNRFYNLLPYHEYSLYIRISAVENDSYASNDVLAIPSVKTNKSIPGIPSIPKIIADTDTSVTLENISGYEYSKDEGNTYQRSNIFSGLTPNTTYYFCQRVAATSTSEASSWSDCNVFTTDIVKPPAPNTPIISSRTDRSITVKSTAGCQYKIDDGDWQDSNFFGNLSPNTSYEVYARYKETPTSLASDASIPLTISTTRSKYTEEILAPVFITKTAYSITIKKVNGYEYRINEGDWQASNVFTGLTLGETYEISQRVAQTQTTEASEPSDYIYITTAKIRRETPSTPICESKTDTKIVLKTMYDNVVYSINENPWTTYNVFNNLKPNTTYRIKQKILEDEDYLESDISAELVIKTKNITPIPTITAIEDTQIKLYIPNGFKVKIDGVTDWTQNNIISGLKPGTEYIVQQIGDENSYVASKIKIKTKINPVPKGPNKLTVYGFTSNTIKVNKEKNCELSLDGITWQNNDTFTKLKSNTEYTIYERKKETETTPASETLKIKVKTSSKTIYGDINNDGKINAKDSLLFKKYLAKYSVNINLLVADINKDNSINIRDILKIQETIFNS